MPEMLLALLHSCFLSNPLILPWIYYTAESICDGIGAIKGFIYPYLKPILKKFPSAVLRRYQQAAPPCRILSLYPFIKTFYWVSLFIAGYCHRFQAGNLPP